MQVKYDKATDEFVVRIPLKDARPSTSGKTIIVGQENAKTGIVLKGAKGVPELPVTINALAYVKNPDHKS